MLFLASSVLLGCIITISQQFRVLKSPFLGSAFIQDTAGCFGIGVLFQFTSRSFNQYHPILKTQKNIFRETIWKSKTPSQVKSFIWPVLNKINTKGMLQTHKSDKALSHGMCLICCSNSKKVENIYYIVQQHAKFGALFWSIC